ncbi:t-SNARE protein [Raphanus sativus]|nr:t-SNARE protein [Raphanus sativus]
MALSDLQTLQNMEIADGSYSHDKFGHYTAVCDYLKTRFMGATKQFQDVLTVRSENMKPHENWKQLFSTQKCRTRSSVRVMQDLYLNLFFGDEVLKSFRSVMIVRGVLAVEYG